MFQKNVYLSHPVASVGTADFTVYGKPTADQQAAQAQANDYAGRGCIQLFTPMSCLTLRPRPDEMRKMAALLIQAADTFGE